VPLAADLVLDDHVIECVRKREKPGEHPPPLGVDEHWPRRNPEAPEQVHEEKSLVLAIAEAALEDRTRSGGNLAAKLLIATQVPDFILYKDHRPFRTILERG
jgi:hypothetical protein